MSEPTEPLPWWQTEPQDVVERACARAIWRLSGELVNLLETPHLRRQKARKRALMDEIHSNCIVLGVCAR